MEALFKTLLNHKKLVILIFAMASVMGAFFSTKVNVNYDLNEYLPDETSSTIAVEIMETEFEGGIPNARVMISNINLNEALYFKSLLKEIDGVSDVIWLDDSISLVQPLTTYDQDLIELYYQNQKAIYTVTIVEDKVLEAVSAIRNLIGEENAMTGAAVNTAVATESTVVEIGNIVKIAVPLVFVILILTTSSWLHPLLLLGTIGISILLNAGSNLLFGEVSFVTNGAGNILQLAVSLDYSVFLLHRFEEYRKQGLKPETAMVQALCTSLGSIMSSGLTTVIGFAALILMRFEIGADLGLALAKGIALSLITVFTLLPVLILLTNKWLEKTTHKPLLPSFDKFGKMVTKLMIPFLILFSMIVIPSYLSQQHNRFYYGAEHIFGETTKIGEDTTAINESFGKSNTLVLMVPKGDTATESKLSKDLKMMPMVSDVISFVDKAGAEIPSLYLDEAILNQLESHQYSRMVITIKTTYEGEEAFEAVEQIRTIANSYYPNQYHLAGESVSTYDLMETITADNVRVNSIAILAVFIVLLLTFKSIILPFILVLAIEGAVWINLSVPYFQDTTLFYLAYLIVGSIQLGSTVDYAILMSSRYLEFRTKLPKKAAIKETVSVVTISILTSGLALTLVGFLLGYISTHGVLQQLGLLIGRGTLIAMMIVFFVLPAMLYLFDKPIEKLTKNIKFLNEGDEKMSLKPLKCTKTNRTLACVLAVSQIFLSSVTSLAATTSQVKEEVVYGILNEDGSVNEISIVNIFNEQGHVVDYGNYRTVRNMTGFEKLTLDQNKVTFNQEEGTLYYEGILNDKNLPWQISIHYFLDGKEYSAQDIAGKSGELTLKLNISQNEKCDETFYKNYALQGTVTLDGTKTKNIVAPNATIANVGSDKQLMYTILPNQGAEIVITANVIEFEMQPMTFNGILLNLNLEVDDSEFSHQVNEISDAVSQLDDGANDLTNGASGLQDGVTKMHSGISDLKNGSGDLDRGILQLRDGILKVQAGLDELNAHSTSLTKGSAMVYEALLQIQASLSQVSMAADQLDVLLTGSSEIKKGIQQIVDGIEALKPNISYDAYKLVMNSNGLNMDDLKGGNSEAIQTLNGQIGSLTEIYNQIKDIPEMTVQAEQLKQSIDQLGSIIYLLNGNNAAISGTESYLNQMAQSISPLYDGGVALNLQYQLFDTALLTLVQTLNNVVGNLTTLSDGINRLVEQYKILDSGITDYTIGVSQVVAGYAEVVAGANELVAGSQKLSLGSSSLYSGSTDLMSGVGTLYDGTVALKDGTQAFKNQTSTLDEDIKEQIDEMITSMTGEGISDVSFASAKNAAVERVQFVIKTTAITLPEIVIPDVHSEEKLNFFEKIMNLFGFKIES